MDSAIKSELLSLAKEVAYSVLDSAYAIAEIIIENSSNKVDDAILPLLSVVKTKLEALIDKYTAEDEDEETEEEASEE